MRNAIAFTSLMVFAAILGTIFRTLENGNPFPLIAFSGVSIVAALTVCAIRFRNWLDRRALKS